MYELKKIGNLHKTNSSLEEKVEDISRKTANSVFYGSLIALAANLGLGVGNALSGDVLYPANDYNMAAHFWTAVATCPFILYGGFMSIDEEKEKRDD